jgi:hypothetical protein
MALSCDGAPYAIGGDSDLSALFRCVSCRYTFQPTSTEKKVPWDECSSAIKCAISQCDGDAVVQIPSRR